MDQKHQVVLVAKLCPTLASPWTASRQAPVSMGFWSGLPLEWVAILE